MEYSKKKKIDGCIGDSSKHEIVIEELGVFIHL